MKIRKQFLVVISLAVTVASTVAATYHQDDKPKYTNLKVLPKNISPHDLQSIMTDEFDDDLGVSCGFCHATNSATHGLDYASDAKPEKAIAREMMRMTLALNKKYMKIKHPAIGNPALAVTCNTCHKGLPIPEGSEPK